MGRKGSPLLDFLKKALEENRYGSYLRYANKNDTSIFVIYLPRKTIKVNKTIIKLLMDWNKIKGKEEIDYSSAKQAMRQALKKSDYLELVEDSIPLTYKILTSEEVKEKKRRKRENNLHLKQTKSTEGEDYKSPPSVESGYYSSSPLSNVEEESPFFQTSMEENLQIQSPHMENIEQTSFHMNNQEPTDALYAIRHDHNFIFPSVDTICECDALQPSFPATDEDDKFLDFDKLDPDFIKENPLSEEEWKTILDDFMSDSLENMLMINTVMEKEALKIYKFKAEVPIAADLVIMFFELENESTLLDKNSCGIRVLLTPALLNRIKSCEIQNSAFVGNYFQLSLKPPVAATV